MEKIGKRGKDKWYPKYAPHIILGTNKSILDTMNNYKYWEEQYDLKGKYAPIKPEITNDVLYHMIQGFINDVMCRRDDNQRRAKQIWEQIKLCIPEKISTEFEIEWSHYKMGELTSDQFAKYIELLKFTINKRG